MANIDLSYVPDELPRIDAQLLASVDPPQRYAVIRLGDEITIYVPGNGPAGAKWLQGLALQALKAAWELDQPVPPPLIENKTNGADHSEDQAAQMAAYYAELGIQMPTPAPEPDPEIPF